MRELNSSEVEYVSGAGIIANIAGSLGSAIGGAVDAGAKLFGYTTDATTPAKTLAQGIGNILEFNISGAISKISEGITGIISFGKDILSQIRGGTSTSSS